MADKDNPARRLLVIFEKARSLYPINANKPARFIWAYVFNISTQNYSDHDEVELIHRLAQLRELIDEVEQTLANLDDINKELYLKPFPNFRKAIPQFPNLGNLYSSYIVHVSDSDMVILQFCLERMSSLPSGPVVEEKQLNELLKEIDDLYREVRASSVNKELQSLILDQLEIIRRAIHEYRIRGVEVLRKALGSTIGPLILNSELIKRESNLEEVSKFSKIFTKFASLVSFASNTTKLIETVGKYLPLLLSGGTDHHQ